MLHYDASASDAGAVQWLLHDPACRVSYQWLVLDSGVSVRIAPDTARAYHAGVCRSSDPRLPYRDANSAFYGISAAATDGEMVTPAQYQTILDLVRCYFRAHDWPLEESWRVVGHETEAYPLGRKHDPTGSDPACPVLSVAQIRADLANPSPLPPAA
jgi:N-acetyl-anhydromuramyl-L-alanine amidase AmpD